MDNHTIGQLSESMKKVRFPYLTPDVAHWYALFSTFTLCAFFTPPGSGTFTEIFSIKTAGCSGFSSELVKTTGSQSQIKDLPVYVFSSAEIFRINGSNFLGI